MKYHFAWKCSYMGTVDYLISDETGTYRAELRNSLGDYERSILNYSPADIVRHVESEIGILRRCVCDNAGEIPAATIAAFNAWRLAENEKTMAHMRAYPERYGTDLSDFSAPPTPVFAGRWNKETGWSRVDGAPAEMAA